MSNFKTLQLTDEERDRLLLAVSGEGGWQNYLRKLQGQLTGNLLSLTSDDLAQAQVYSKGQGGWQDRIAPILAASQGTRILT